MLLSDCITHSTVSCILSRYSQLHVDSDAFVSLIAEVISDIREPITLQQQNVGHEEKRQAELKVWIDVMYGLRSVRCRAVKAWAAVTQLASFFRYIVDIAVASVNWSSKKLSFKALAGAMLYCDACPACWVSKLIGIVTLCFPQVFYYIQRRNYSTNSYIFEY